MKQNYIDLKMPSIMGMGAVGPTLAVLTASLYSALMVAIETPPHWSYPVIMLVLAGLLAVFPVSKEKIPKWQKLVLWPIVAVIVFAAAWGTNHGLSIGETALNSKVSNWEIPSLVSSAYAQDTNAVELKKSMTNLVQVTLHIDLLHARTNKVDFATLNLKNKDMVDQKSLRSLPAHVWGLDWLQNDMVLLRASDGKWWSYRKLHRTKRPVINDRPQQQQQKLRGGFFKRWK